MTTPVYNPQTVVTLATATDPGHHPYIISNIAVMPFLNSPLAVILGGNDLKNNATLATTALALAATALAS